MNQEPKTRTASDILLSLEGKVDTLMQLHRNLDLNIKILSNKFNQITSMLSEPLLSPDLDPAKIALAPPSYQAPDFKLNVQDELFIPKETGLSVDTAPVGFRRTSRPETFSSVSAQERNVPTPSITQPVFYPPKAAEPAQGQVPVQQRIVDKNGKSLFMCSVEIIDAKTNLLIAKTRTNGTGKWQASLAPGNYRVATSKMDGLSKQNLEAIQNITIDAGMANELPMMILKAKGAKV